MIEIAIRSDGMPALPETRPLMARLGRGLERDLRRHFLARDREGNRRGWPTRHFWAREVRAHTALTHIAAESATVAIASPPFAQKLYGGVIRPKRGRMLALPVTAEAYTAGSPKNWPASGRRYLFRPTGRRFLAVREAAGGRGSLRVQYVLVPSVTQAPDARALPDIQAVSDRLTADAEAWIAAQMRRVQA